MFSSSIHWAYYLYILFWSGTVHGSVDFPKLTFSESVRLRAGVNKISLLSVAVGLPVRFPPLYFCLRACTWLNILSLHMKTNWFFRNMNGSWCPDYVYVIHWVRLYTECWSTIWNMKRWYSRSNHVERTQWREKGLNMAEVVIQGWS
jgi:hypothetical protein